MSAAADPERLLEELVGSVMRLAAGAVPLRRVRVRCGPAAIEVEWQEHGAGTDPPPAPDGPAPVTQPEDTLGYVTAPLIGTFFHAPSPDAPPFVRVGDTVEAQQQVGIIESMKLMNALEAPCAGRVAAVLVPDGTAVEYDERLIALEPLPADV